MTLYEKIRVIVEKIKKIKIKTIVKKSSLNYALITVASVLSFL